MSTSSKINTDDFVLPESIPVISVRNTVFFPHQFIPLAIGRPKSLRLIEHAIREDMVIGVLTQKDGSIDDPNYGDLFTVGTVARISSYVRVSQGR